MSKSIRALPIVLVLCAVLVSIPFSVYAKNGGSKGSSKTASQRRIAAD